MRSCTAHVHTDTNNNFLSTTGEHNHLLEPENLKVKQFRTILKERVVNETVPIQKIYDEEIVKAHFTPETLASVPMVHNIRIFLIVQLLKMSFYFLSLEPGLNQARRKLTPTLPVSNLFDIPDCYQTTASNETFLICDKLISRRKRMLTFGSPKQLQLLFDSSIIFMDGTFLTAPPFFDQVFTIHGLQFDCGTLYIVFHKRQTVFPVFQLYRVYLLFYLIGKNQHINNYFKN